MEVFSPSCHNTRMAKPLDILLERESVPARVGPRVQALRETLRLQKSEFADSIGLDRSSLTKIEAGRAGLDIYMGERIAVIYGFGLDYIYRGDLSDVPLDLRPQLMVNLVSLRKPA